MSDLGFIAKIVDGKKGFVLYGAGGFGGNPRVSIKLRDFINAEDILYYIQAMKNVFEAEGDRTNKHKARIRYILMRLGQEKFIELFESEVEKLKKEGGLEVKVKEDEFIVNKTERFVKNVEISKELENILFPQKQPGFYSVYVHPQSGNLEVSNLDSVLDFIAQLDYEISIRITNTQAFFIRDLKEKDAEKLIDIIGKFTSIYAMDNSVTCVGASTCQLGLCLSQNLLQAIKEKFKNETSEVRCALPRLFISGCPNSCAQHEKAVIGLHGRAKRTDDGLIPMYQISFGGKLGENPRMGEAYGDIPAKKVPEFLHELAYLKLNSGCENFYDFIEKNNSDIRTLFKEYTDVDKFKGDSGIYFDFGSCEKFSLKGRGPGECSTGVMDVINLDLSNAKTALDKYRNTKDNKDLYASALASARTLLVLRGVDTNKDREIFAQFAKNFVNAGYVKKSVKDLFDTLIDFKIGDIDDISDKIDEVEYLFNKVNDMYKSLDGKLEITLAKENETVSKAVNTENNSEAENDTEVVDFRGVKCPINFVKVKIELSKIKSGEKKGFYIDDGDPINNVPESVKKEGHKIVSIDKNYDGYNLLVIEKK